jgi:filamentous hemagglutinin family protein
VVKEKKLMKIQECCWCDRLFLSAIVLGASLISGDRTLAQSRIAPDETLGYQNSRVTPNVEIKGTPSEQIDGGARRGGNLFHSFREFNVNEGRGAYFTNPAGVENIFSRVTGGNPSEILGKLGVIGGDANLFFINPNGIIFGANASLDVGGSFLATTADGIGFGETGQYQNDNSWSLGYEGVSDFGNIKVEGAVVDVSGDGGGSLQIQARQLDVLRADIFANTLGSNPGGEVLVNTTQDVTLSNLSFLTADVTPEGTGAGGLLTINTGN